MTTPSPRPVKRLRLHASSGFQSLLLYLLGFALPLLWQWAGLWLVYPYKLAHTAPAIVETLLSLLPIQPEALKAAAAEAALPTGSDPALWTRALALRDEHWRLFAAGWFSIAWLVTLGVQLLWRVRHSRGFHAARLARRARRSYYVSLLVILLVNGAFAALLWFVGVRYIQSRTLWDWLVYFPAYGLNVLAAIACFRLAAPAAISGRHAFFKRL